MISAWTVGIRLTASSNVAGVFAGIQSGARQTQAQIHALQNRLTSLSGMATAGLGASILGAMGSGIKGAADLQTALVLIKNATGATADQMDRLRDKAFDLSSATAQSVVDSAKIMKVMATAGINDPEKLLKIAKPAALFADVQFLARGVSFESGAKQAIQLAHLYQTYTPEKIMPIFDQLTKLSMMMPDTLDRYLTQAAYYMPSFKRFGVSDQQSLVAGAFLDRMGLGRGKGGTGLQNFVMQQMGSLVLTEHVQGERLKALKRMGLVDEHGKSNFYHYNARTGKMQFDLFGSLEQINKAIDARTHGLRGSARESAEQKAIVDIQKALGIVGGRVGFLGTHEAVEQLHQMMAQLGKMPGLVQQQADLMNTLNAQWQLFKTNVQSLLTELAGPWVNNLRDLFRYLGDRTHDLQSFFHRHKGLEKLAMAGIGAVGLGLLATGGLATLGITAAGLGALGSTGVLAALAAPFVSAGGIVVAAFGLLTGPIGIAALAVAGLGAAFYWLAKHPREVGNALRWLVDFALAPFRFAILAFNNPMAALRGAFQGLADLINSITGLFHKLAAPSGPSLPGQRGRYGYIDKMGAFHAYNHGNVPVVQQMEQGIAKAVGGWWNEVLTKPADPASWRGDTHDLIAPRSARAKPTHVSQNITVNLNVPYHAPPGEDDASHRRRANAMHRELAEQVFKRGAEVLRTAALSAGSVIQTSGMSTGEFGVAEG